jgi:hypothetical protein
MQLTPLPPVPHELLDRLASIPGASLVDIAEAAYERGFSDGLEYKTVRAQEAARKKDIAIVKEETAGRLATLALFRSDLEASWYRALCNAYGSIAYEPQTYWVSINGQNRNYTPDFQFTASDGREVHVEVKPASWLNPPRTNPWRKGYGRQLVTMQAVVKSEHIFLYVLSGTPTSYEAFQVLGLEGAANSKRTLLRCGKHKGLPPLGSWTVVQR